MRHVVFAGIAETRIERRRDGVIAGMREAAAEILDVLVHAEDFLHHQHHRRVRLAGRPRAIGRDLAVADGER